MKTGCWGKLIFYPMPPLAAPRIRTLVQRGERGCGLRRVRHGVAHRPDLARPVQRRGSRTPAENDVRRLLVLLASKVHEQSFFFSSAFRWRKAAKSLSKSFYAFRKKLFFPCFSMAKSSKSHTTDSDVGVRKAESGVGRLSAGLQANRPAALAFSPPDALSPSEPSRGSPCG